MTATIDIGEVETRLAAGVARAEAGEEIVICRNGRPVARLAPAVGNTIETTDRRRSPFRATSGRRSRTVALKGDLQPGSVAPVQRRLDEAKGPVAMRPDFDALPDDFMGPVR